jgi:hypothetical protein
MYDILSLTNKTHLTGDIHISNISCTKSHIHISSLGSFIQRISPGPRLFYDSSNKFIFCGEGLLAQRPILKLEDHRFSFSAAAYSIYSQLSSIAGGLSSIRNPRTRHAVVTGTHLVWQFCKISITILDIMHSFYLETQHFGDRILSPSSGGTC